MNITWGLILTRDKASVLVGGRGCIFIHSCSVRLISFEVKAEPEYAPPQLTRLSKVLYCIITTAIMAEN